MSVNILLDKAQAPDDELIQRSLGATWPFFVELRTETGVCEQEWRHYGKKYGWKLKVHAQDKTLLELTVADRWFLVAMAIREAERRELETNPALAAFAHTGDAAQEGYGIRFEVRDRASCDRAKDLARFVMARRKLVAHSG
jgi:hypothetical protein